MDGVYVVVNAHEANDGSGYGAVSSKHRAVRSVGGNSLAVGRAAGIIGSTVALLGLLALATMSREQQTGPVVEESTFSGSVQRYNQMTGMLVTKFADPGLNLDVYWGGSTDFSGLTGSWDTVKSSLGSPQLSTYTTSINFPDAATLEATVGKALPKHDSDKFPSVILVWKGKFEVVKGGSYNLTLDSSPAGAVLNVEGETLTNTDGGPLDLSDVNLGSGFHEISVIWKAPAVDTAAAHVLLKYTGPDTNDESVFLSGVHFADDLDKKSRKAAAQMVKSGFGVVEYKVQNPDEPFADSGSELPSLSDVLNSTELTPLVGARLKTIDMANHDEFVAKLKDRRFPTEHAVLLVQGLIKIETAGDYNFTLESDDGARLFIDNQPIADTRDDEGGELLHNESVSAVVPLQHGWHTARVIWFQNSTTNDRDYKVPPPAAPGKKPAAKKGAAEATDPNRPRDFQDLRVLYSGPDTGGDSLPVKGYHLKGVPSTGSLAGLTLSDGSDADDDSDNKPRNWASHFDQEWLSDNKDKPWRVYDEKDWQEEIGDHVTKIVQPVVDYDAAADAHVHTEVPDSVYDHAAPYDHEVVDLGGKGIEWKHKEQTGEYLQTVIGKPTDWQDDWDKTPNSVGDLSG